MPAMSDQPASDPHASDPHASDVPGHDGAAAHHATDDHGDDHGHDDHGHGSDEAALGPIDSFAWGAGLLGVLAGIAVVIAFILATAGTTPAV
jgi:hypothetical protein